jgi:hypothetical protein
LFKNGLLPEDCKELVKRIPARSAEAKAVFAKLAQNPAEFSGTILDIRRGSYDEPVVKLALGEDDECTEWISTTRFPKELVRSMLAEFVERTSSQLRIAIECVDSVEKRPDPPIGEHTVITPEKQNKDPQPSMSSIIADKMRDLLQLKDEPPKSMQSDSGSDLSLESEEDDMDSESDSSGPSTCGEGVDTQEDISMTGKDEMHEEVTESNSAGSSGGQENTSQQEKSSQSGFINPFITLAETSSCPIEIVMIDDNMEEGSDGNIIDKIVSCDDNVNMDSDGIDTIVTPTDTNGAIEDLIMLRRQQIMSALHQTISFDS